MNQGRRTVTFSGVCCSFRLLQLDYLSIVLSAMRRKYFLLLEQLHNYKNKNFMYPVLRLKVHQSDLVINQILEMGSRYLYESR